MRRLAILLVIVLLSGCGCLKKYPHPEVIIKDSIKVEYRERVIHDSIPFEVPKIVERVVTKDTVSHLENEWAESDAMVSNGLLSHSLETRPHTVYVPYEVTVYDTITVESHNQSEFITVEVEKKLNLWQKIRLASFYPLLLLALWGCRKGIWRIIKAIFGVKP